MGKIKFNIHFTFIIFSCILIYFGQGLLLVNYVLTILLHEMAHAVVAKSLGYNIRRFLLMPFGISLSLTSTIMPPRDEIKVAIAGPLFNFSVVVFFLAVWWVFPFTFNYTYLFCYANFVEGLFNLLPAFPLDGGRIFRAVINQCFGMKKAVKICFIVNIFLCLILVVLFILSLFISVNLTYLFVIFCIFPLNKKETPVYSFINYAEIKQNKKVMRIKNLYVLSSEKIFSVCKLIDSFTYLNLYIYDDRGILVKIMGERELLSKLDSYPCHATIGELVMRTQNNHN